MILHNNVFEAWLTHRLPYNNLKDVARSCHMGPYTESQVACLVEECPLITGKVLIDKSSLDTKGWALTAYHPLNFHLHLLYAGVRRGEERRGYGSDLLHLCTHRLHDLVYATELITCQVFQDSSKLYQHKWLAKAGFKAREWDEDTYLFWQGRRDFSWDELCSHLHDMEQALTQNQPLEV